LAAKLPDRVPSVNRADPRTAKHPLWAGFSNVWVLLGSVLSRLTLDLAEEWKLEIDLADLIYGGGSPLEAAVPIRTGLNGGW
jgi:hypothetical protein